MWNELRRLVKLGVMSEVEERPHVVNALSVVYSNKKRLVWDARALNELIDVEKLTLESLDDAAELLEENFFGATWKPVTSRWGWRRSRGPCWAAPSRTPPPDVPRTSSATP